MVTNNNCVDNWGAGIKFAPEYGWLAAGSGNNVVMSGNNISGCHAAAIEAYSEGGDRTISPVGAHDNIQIINNIFIDGQLDECELTLKDINNIAKCFKLVLGGIFHYRVDYPEPVSKERSTEKISRSADENRDRKSTEVPEGQKDSTAKGSTEDLKRLGMS